MPPLGLWPPPWPLHWLLPPGPCPARVPFITVSDDELLSGTESKTNRFLPKLSFPAQVPFGHGFITAIVTLRQRFPRVSWQARLSGIGLALGLVRDPDPINKVFVGSVVKEDPLFLLLTYTHTCISNGIIAD